MRPLLGCSLFLVLFSLASTANPGVKLRITQKGITYANSVAQALLAKELKTLHLDNQSGKDGHIKWELKNIQNRGVNPPTTKLSFDPPHNAIAWSLSGLGISLHADWRIKYKKGWFKISTSGSVDVKVKRVSVAVSITLGIAKDGRPSLNTASCNANVGDVDLDFHGGTGWLINLFKHPLEKKVQRLLQDQICKIVTKEINVDGNQALAKLKVTYEMDHRFILDYSLSAAPAVTSAFLDILDKGEVYWKTDKKEAPFPPNPIPALSDTSRMLYLWVTEYPAKTILYVAHTHDYLKLNISKKDLPGKIGDYLDTTCKLVCVGKLIPVIGQKYPNRQVKLEMSSNAVPDFAITPNGISLALKSNIAMYAEATGQQPAYLLTLNITLSLSVKGQITNERLVGEITSHSFKLGLVKSAVGPFNPTLLNGILEGIVTLVVIPRLNSIAEKGIDLPVTGQVKFQNTNLSLLQGSLLIATDLTYNPTDETSGQDEWDVVAKQLDTFDQQEKSGLSNRQAEWNEVAKQLDTFGQTDHLIETGKEAKKQWDKVVKQVNKIGFDEQSGLMRWDQAAMQLDRLRKLPKMVVV